jgi:hypothetical protein
MLKPCCGSGIRCFYDPFIRDWGWKKSRDRVRDPGSGMNIPDMNFENLVSVFGVKNTSNSLMQIWIWDLVNPGSGMEIIGSGNQDPG